jgi:serine/threonine-protein kinase
MSGEATNRGPPALGASSPPEPRETIAGEASRTVEVGERPVSLDFLAPPAGPDELGRLGHYRVLKLLGRGGMGAVFQAEDTQLQRVVALKVILPEYAANRVARERFLREARACAGLHDDHVVTIYQVDQDRDVPFLAMEFLEGQSLQERLNRGGPVPIPEVLRIGREVAAGLAAAHAHGVIHRDIKPANVWLQAPDGRVKLLDFGLARPPGSRSDLSHTGDIVGTPEFMSPEQARGLELDGRSDLFSLGAVLYTLCAGQKPFQGDGVMAVLMAIGLDDPVPVRERNPDAPPALAELIERLLAKAPAGRPASAGEVLATLAAVEAGLPGAAPRVSQIVPAPAPPPAPPPPDRRPRRFVAGIAAGVLGLAAAAAVVFWLTRPTPLPEPARTTDARLRVIAVLPFRTTAADQESAYLRDGIPGALLKRLSEVEQLTVRPYSASPQNPDQKLDLRAVGRQVEAQVVLAGRVQQTRGRLSVQVELVNVRDNRVLWVEQYERGPADLQDIETDIAQRVCARLGVELSRQEEGRLARRDTADPEAYRLYLQGRYYMLQSTVEGMKQSVACFQQAIARDPRYALAYAGLADTYGYYAGDWVPYEEALPQQKAAARKARELGDNLAETHLALGNVFMGQDHDWAGAEKELRRAIELNPRLDLAHDAYAQLLAFQGRFEESVARQKKALEINPLSPSLIANLSYLYYLQRRYEEAMEQAHKALEIDPSFVVAHDYLGAAYLRKGRFAEALGEFRKCRQLDNIPWYLARLAAAQATAGNRDEARTLLKELQEWAKRRYIAPECFFLVHVGLGETDQAFAWLRRMYDVRSQYPLRLNVQPDFDGLRADPRFAEWLRRLKLRP